MREPLRLMLMNSLMAMMSLYVLEENTKSYVDEGEEQLGNAQLEEHMKAKYNGVGEGSSWRNS